VIRTVLIALIRAYQYAISPLLGQRCKYYPSCSSYAIDALREHGAIRGLGLASWRLLRCNPFSNGGYDPVPERHPGCAHGHAKTEMSPRV
jgi:putative membrane protein insertion efficiency factor